jgi:predicted N-acetyltransferase YhbS
VDYLIRAARITDIDRFVALCDEALPPNGGSGAIAGPILSADLLRQLVYLPQASVLVAEEGRDMVGGAVLALRPSVRAGGYVGTVDLLAVDPRRDVDRVTTALIEELLRSARNKGCTVVEAASPDDPIERDRWDRLGFAGAGPLIERPVASDRAAARR